MATINDIQTQILTEASNADSLPATAVLTDNEKATLDNLTNTSRVSVFRLFIFVMSVVIWSRQQLWDILKRDIESRVRRSIPFSKNWFIDTALLYQHGDDLPESGIYDNTGQSIRDIEAKKIVARAAVEAFIVNGFGSIRMKVAKLVNGELVKLPVEELAGFRAYMEKMTAAGISVVSSSDDADLLRANIKIYFDPLIISNTGARLDGSDNAPAITALTTFLKDKNEEDFNGELALDELVDVLQKVDGFKNIFMVSANSTFGGRPYRNDPTTNTGPIVEFRKPNSGYFKLDEANSVFTYISKPD